MIGDNNIFNIRYNRRNKWQGQIGQKHGFCVFDTADHGIRAAYVLLVNYVRNGYDTIEKIISRFAPSSENDTENYIKFCCAQTPVLPPLPRDKEIVTYHDLFSLMIKMAKMENGYGLGISTIRKAILKNEDDTFLFNRIKI